MKIIDNKLSPYEIHYNGNSYDVMEKTNRTDKNDDLIFKTHSFCATMEHALLKIAYLKTDLDKIYSLDEYVLEIKRVKKEILNVTK